MQSKSQKKTAHYSHISRMASPVEDVHCGDGPKDHDAAGGAAAASASKNSLKKGPWTAAEDAMLIEYVRRHGEGNWNAVQRNSGLQRCGKSCRLRWANHLRPNLKKGAFTPEEERLILELHAKFGNKWARMASQLPGRTDNEIKNYWNTRMKRRLRAGLPLYPVDIQRESSQFIRQPQHHHHHNHHRQNRLQKHQKQPEKKIEFSAQMISSTYNNDNNSPSSHHSSFIDQINFLSPQNTIQNQQNPSYFTLPIQEFNFICDASNTTNAAKNNNNSNSTNGFVLPLLSHISRHHLVSSYPGPNNPSSTPLFDQSFSTQLWTNSASTPLQQKLGFVPLLNANQSPIGSSTSPAAGVGCNHNVVGGNPKSGYEIERPALYQGNSGLLEDMLKDVQLRSSTSNNNENRNEEEISFELDKDNENNNNGVVSCKNDNQLALEISGMHGGLLWKENSETTPGNQLDDSTSGQSSTGMKKKPRVEVNALDDELTSLLNSFPSSSPIQQWYHRNGEMSNGESSSRFTTGHDVVMDVGHDQTAPSPPPISADENDCNAMDQSLNLGTTICHNSTTTIY